MTNFETNRAPKTLSAEARRWWAAIQEEYAIADSPGRLLLMTALESYDRMRQAQRAVKKDGPIMFDRFKQARPHPMLVVEKDSRSQMLAALKQLNLDLEPLSDRNKGRR